MPGLQHTVTIAAPPERVWAVVVDVERWPERIPTVDAVERLDAGPLAVGSRTRLQQPRLPTAVWTVTELADGSSYTWESSSPGVTVTAAHVVEPHPDGSRLTLALTVSGPLSGIGWLLTRSLTKRYVETEAASIKRAAETSTKMWGYVAGKHVPCGAGSGDLTGGRHPDGLWAGRADRICSSCVASRYRIREPDEYPPSILIIWPQAPSVIDPRGSVQPSTVANW